MQALILQTFSPFNFNEVGVDMFAIVAIIALTQLLKRYIPKRHVVLLPLGLSVVAYLFNSGLDLSNPIEMIYYGGAAALLYQLTEKYTDGLLKSHKALQEIDNGK